MLITIYKLIGCTIIALITGLLGSFGGAEQTIKNWRRIGIPVIFTIIALVFIQHWLVLSILAMIGVFCIGYGLPEEDPRWGLDEGSVIGRFWYYFFKKKTKHYELWANLLTRGVIGAVLGLSLVSIPIITKKWLIYAIITIVNISIYSGLSWRYFLANLNIKGKELLITDVITYGLLGLMISILILY